MLKFKKLFVVTAFLAITSCTSVPTDPTADNYEALVNHFTDRAEFYVGFNNIFQFHATILNNSVLKAQLESKTKYFGLTPEQKSVEEKKLDDSLKTEATVFLSFYSPEPKIDDLERAQSVWRIFLDVNNHRYSGTVKKYTGSLSEATLYYPFHSRFPTGYVVRFNVPMINIQDMPSKFTITGTMGSKTVSFPALK